MTENDLLVNVNQGENEQSDYGNVGTGNVGTEMRMEHDEEEESDEEPDYKIDKLLPKQNQKEKLIEQNIKLKTQIYELAVQLDQILLKDRSKKKKYGVFIEEDDEAVKAKKLELKRQELQIVEVKNKIFELKRQLDSVFNNQIVQESEDKLKHIKIELKRLEDERDGLTKIRKGQIKAIKTIKNEDEYRQKIQQTHKEVLKVKEETQKLMERALEARKNEINCHERYVLKKQKLRELENKLAVNQAKGVKEKQKGKAVSMKDSISNDMISELEDEIKKLEQQKKEGEKVWQQKIRTIEVQLLLKKNEEERKLLILRQKQKELKLNEIRIRELRKLVKANIIAENTKNQEDMDMSQYRHKRNIRYIQK